MMHEWEESLADPTPIKNCPKPLDLAQERIDELTERIEGRMKFNERERGKEEDVIHRSYLQGRADAFRTVLEIIEEGKNETL